MNSIELNTIYTSDCIKLSKRIPDSYVDLVIADYPFSYFFSSGLVKRKREEDLSKFVLDSLTEFQRILKENGNIAIFWQSMMAYKYSHYVYDLFKIRNMVVVKGLIRWSWYNLPFNYNILTLAHNGKCTSKWKRITNLTDFWDWDSIRTTEKRVHREQISDVIVKRVLTMTTKKSDLVFDPFTGSGTVPRCCKEMSRNFIACDINKKWTQYARLSLLDKETTK